MSDTAKTEFWRDLKPIERVFRDARCPRRSSGRGDRRRALLRAVHRDRRLAAVVDLAVPEPLGRRAVREGAGLVNRHYHPQQVSRTRSPASGATWSTTGSPPPATSSTSCRARATR